MSESPALLYLEADDEITAVVRRLRAADLGRVVVVAPGRSRATSSAVALRLLARAAEADGRDLAIVGDALTRSLATDAGIPAYATVDEARRADGPAAAAAATSPHASIHVVRGPATEDTAPTLAAAPGPIGSDELTRPVPVARHPRRPPQARRAARRLPAALLAALGLLLVGAVVAGAVLLPAATITIAARTEPIGPLAATLSFPDAARDTGTVEATATVTATDTYETLEPASGSVLLFNWTFFPVSVPAGTFVAAGEQAYATQSDVVVPRAMLTPDGRIAAGDVGVAVVAAAPGPAGNVAANAINVVVNESIDDQLGGVPENPEPRVLNPEPTGGGVDEAGPSITQADVDAAVSLLREELGDLRNDATAGEPGEIVLEVARAEPVVTGADGLAGTQDQAEAEITGRLAWETLRVAESEVREAAEERLRADPDALPAGQELVPGSARAEVIGAEAAADGLQLEVLVTGASVAMIDTEAVAERVAGLAPDDAREELRDIGQATVDLWPGWVATVPELTSRVEVRVVEPEPIESAAPDVPASGVPEASP